MAALYAEWNSHVNLISRKDIKNLYVNHVLHSLGIAKVILFNADATVIDIGTGGGFPGIPLAVLFPNTKFYLIDSIGKKIRAVNEVAKTLNLDNVIASQIRVEDLKGTFDFAVSRAVASLHDLWHWSANRLKPQSTHTFSNGLFCLKGGIMGDELLELRRPAKIIDLSSFFAEEFFKTKKIVYVPADPVQHSLS